MEALVKEKVAGFELAPWGERAGWLAVLQSLFFVMHVGAGTSGSGASVLLENFGQDVEFVCFRIEVAEVVVALRVLLSDTNLHRLAVITVESIALDVGSHDVLASEDQLKDRLHRRGACAG